MPKLSGFQNITEYTVVFTEEEMIFLSRLLGNRHGTGNNRRISNAIYDCLMSAKDSDDWDTSDVLEVCLDGGIVYCIE